MLKRIGFAFCVLCVLIAFGSTNIAVSLLGSSAVWDLSRGGRYSLSSDTEHWLANNQADIFMRLYISPEDKQSSAVRNYIQDVVRLLEQYQLLSAGKISVRTITVEQPSPASAEAKKQGIKTDSDPILGLVISDENGNFESISRLNPDNRAYLEHDISRLLGRLGGYKKPKVGIVAPDLTVMPTKDALDYTADWPFIDALRQDYDLELLSAQNLRIPEDLRAVLLINPRGLAQNAVYAVDQYLLHGGRLLIFDDPYPAMKPDSNRGNEAIFEKLLANWGIRIIDHNSAALRQTPDTLAALGADGLFEGIWPLDLHSAGSIDYQPRPETDFEPLLISDDGQEPQIAAAKLEGNFMSLFPEQVGGNAALRAGADPFISISLSPGKIILVADSDLLNSSWWNANRTPAQSPEDFVLKRGNLDFIKRSLDYLTDNKKALNAAPKQRSGQTMPISEVFLNLAEQAAAPALIQNQKEYDAALNQKARIIRQIRAKEIMPSIKTAKQTEALNRRILELEQQKAAITAGINNSYLTWLYSYIVLNGIIPFVFLGIYIFIRWRGSKKLATAAVRMVKNA